MSSRSPLDPYREKRDPARTPEPFGESGGRPAHASHGSVQGPARFVVQKHWARALHYDFRLELDGVLKSWAVPKGPSTRAEEKRLAVHVEDHPLEYVDFEGVIPSGNYGAGSVIVWDRGTYGSFKPDDLLEQYARGKLELELSGWKLRGRWTLVRMGKHDKEWLLLKKEDGFASEREAIDRRPESVITGLTVEEMRDVAGWRAALRERVVALGAPRGRVPVARAPFMLATPAARPPGGDDWSFEIKYDGVRVMAERADDQVTLVGRSGEDITARYPEVAEALAALPEREFVVDGEIVAEDEAGRPSFQRLQPRMHLQHARDVAAARARVPVRALCFDCLALAGHDLRALPLAERQELLDRVMPPLGIAQRTDRIVGRGAAFYEAAYELGLEGVVAKQRGSRYSAGRGAAWQKIKCHRRQEFVIGGTTPPQGARARFGALHVGVYEAGALVYVTKVGTGFDDATLDAIARKLEPLVRATSPFERRSPRGRGDRWFEPRLVCEVRFTEWTRDGGLRHPTFLGLRADKRAEECTREPERAGSEACATPGTAPDAAAIEPASPAPTPTPTTPVPKPKPEPEPELATPEGRVRVTNPKKVFWPADGLTKGDLVAYYDAIAPWMLRYLRDRPIVLTRYPDGIDGKSFFQKDAPVYVPDWVRTETVRGDEDGRDIRYFVLDDAPSLRYVANLGTIPIHAWGARVGSLDAPDWLVLDLDPKGAPFTQVVQVARTLKTILDRLELPSGIKTSGATGLHVLIPMGRRYTHDEVRTFARVLAMLVVDAAPELATVTRAIQARGGKVYVDFGQNGHGVTIAAPFSVRPVAGGRASCPLRWDEVTPRLDPAAFTLRTIPPRFESMEDPLAFVLGDGVDMAAAIGRMQRHVGNGKETA